MRLIAVLGITACTCLVGASASTATAAASPQRLYTSLLITPFPDPQLPSGFDTARVTLLKPKPSGNAMRHHVVGEVAVDMNGPDPDDGIFYVVFPTARDARADLSRAVLSRGHFSVVGKVPGYSLPSIWLVGSLKLKNVAGGTDTDGATVMALVKGNVLVLSFTDSGTNLESGNTPAALELLKAALHHLALVQAKL
jgi:hypothetical protein